MNENCVESFVEVECDLSVSLRSLEHSIAAQRGCTAIMHAAARGHFSVVQLLRAKGADLRLQNKVGRVWSDKDWNRVRRSGWLGGWVRSRVGGFCVFSLALLLRSAMVAGFEKRGGLCALERDDCLPERFHIRGHARS